MPRVSDQTPEDPAEDQPSVPRAGQERESEGSPEVPDEHPAEDVDPEAELLVPEDERQYPALDGPRHTTDRDGTPIIVAPSTYGRGYQTVTVNPDRPHDEVKREARRKRRRRRNLVLAGAFGVFVLMVAALSFGLKGLLPQPAARDYEGPGGEQVSFTVNQGEGALAIGTRLVEQDIVASQDAFITAMNQARSDNDIQPGDYELKRQMPAADAVSVLLREGQEAVHYVAINRGMRLNEAFEALSTSTGRPVEEFQEAGSDPSAFGLPDDAPSLEGYLAPGEYRFPVTTEPVDVLKILVEPTFAALEDLGITDEEEQFRTVTIASIVEAEALPSDYAMVAGIIENRLQPNEETNGYLQIDATLIYGLGQRQLQFSEAEKQNADNKYNSYYYRGLPPGPIGAPSREALEAAAEPEDSDYFYWITTNIETGETKFSEDYAQHRAYQQEYREYCAQNADICGNAGSTAGDGATPSSED